MDLLSKASFKSRQDDIPGIMALEAGHNASETFVFTISTVCWESNLQLIYFDQCCFLCWEVKTQIHLLQHTCTASGSVPLKILHSKKACHDSAYKLQPMSLKTVPLNVLIRMVFLLALRNESHGGCFSTKGTITVICNRIGRKS